MVPIQACNMIGIYLLVVLSTLASLEGVAGVNMYQYLGCFHNEEYAVEGINEMVVTGATDNTPNHCGYICEDAGFRYAGMIDGSRCQCGNGYKSHSPRSDCSTPCPGDSTKKCGGTTSVSVYTTGKACFSDLWNVELYIISDPTKTIITESGETLVKQYNRSLGHEGCQQACARDQDCVSYSYYTSSKHESMWGERCFGFTLHADASEDTFKDNMASGKLKACNADDSENFIGETIGMIIAILFFIATIAFIHEKKK